MLTCSVREENIS